MIVLEGRDTLLAVEHKTPTINNALISVNWLFASGRSTALSLEQR
jgi:hypothetical protein